VPKLHRAWFVGLALTGVLGAPVAVAQAVQPSKRPINAPAAAGLPAPPVIPQTLNGYHATDMKGVAQPATPSDLKSRKDSGQGVLPAVRTTAKLGTVRTALPPLDFTFRRTAYAMHSLPENMLPYRLGSPIPRVDTGVKDAAGVRMYKVGNKLYNHPVAQAGYGLDNLESYVLSNDAFYLTRAKAQAERLMTEARNYNGGWFIRYPFTFDLHGMASERLYAPWFSGMAQGQALSLFVRLYEVTKEPKYKNAADGVYATFLLPKGKSNPWSVFVDTSGNLWFEEYAGPHPDKTYNGHIFAAWGVWDYWRITQEPTAKTLFQGGLTTIAENFHPHMRTPNWRSKYCKAHPQVDSDKYHYLHSSLLYKTYMMTQNYGFARYADVLVQDAPYEHHNLTIGLHAGRQDAVKFDVNGKVTARKSVTLPAPSQAPANLRRRVKGQPGLWYQITAGTFAGHYLQENPRRALMRGQILRVSFYPARTATMNAGSVVTGYVFRADGSVASAQSYRPTVATNVAIGERSYWNGTLYLKVSQGPLAGHHIPATSVLLY
jgi:D-glucuronyl C5-epimerase C-terminus